MRIRSVFQLVLAVALAIMISVPLAPQTASAASTGKTFTVNNVNDLPDANPGDGKCETGTGNSICTLRAAIQEANALADADTILLQATTYQLQRAGNDVNALNDLPFTVSATASSGLPVSFSSETPNVCTASGNTVTLLNAGSCTIMAAQAGDATYNPAALVSRSFAVTSPNSLTHKIHLPLMQR